MEAPFFGVNELASDGISRTVTGLTKEPAGAGSFPLLNGLFQTDGSVHGANRFLLAQFSLATAGADDDLVRGFAAGEGLPHRRI
jgi:hypothetical protein